MLCPGCRWLHAGEAAALAAWAEEAVPDDELAGWLASFPHCARIPLVAALRLRVLATLDENAMTCH